MIKVTKLLRVIGNYCLCLQYINHVQTLSIKLMLLSFPKLGKFQVVFTIFIIVTRFEKYGTISRISRY